MFVFDTDHLSLLQRTDAVHDKFDARLSEYSEVDFWVSVVSFHEQVLGSHTYLARAKTPDQLVIGYSRFERLLLAFADYQLLSFDEAAAEVFADLQSRNTRVGTMDLRIAAITIANNMTLLTRNTIDFEKISGLPFEDWIS